MGTRLDNEEDIHSSLGEKIKRRIQQLLRLIWGPFICGILVNVLSGRLVVTSLPLAGTPLGWFIEYPLVSFSSTFVLMLLTILAWSGIRGTSYYRAQNERLAILHMLQSAYKEERDASLQDPDRAISLNLEERLDLTLKSFKPKNVRRPHPIGTTIVDTYDRAGESLLIVGAPGAGKSFLLYELALALLARAELDETKPLPVILNLSSRRQRNSSFEEWIAQELELHHHRSHRFWQQWQNKGRLFPLLDGLDDAILTTQGKCIETINTYYKEHMVPLVVCTREQAYREQSHRLALQGAVEVQSLSHQYVEAYLEEAGTDLAAVRFVVEQDAELKKLLTTPLMLTIVMRAYQGETVLNVSSHSKTQWQDHIFNHYIQRMLNEKPLGFGTAEQMLHWLTKLAQQVRPDEELYVEKLQPNWLETWWTQHLYAWVGVILPSVLIGLLVTAILTSFILPTNDVWGIFSGSLPGGVVGGLLGYEQVPWSQSRGKRQWFVVLTTAIFLGLGTALATIFIDLHGTHGFSLALIDSYARTDGAIFGMWALLLTIGLSIHKSADQRLNASTDNQSITIRDFVRDMLTRNTIQKGILIGISASLSYGLSHELKYGVAYALSNALSYALSYTLSGILIGVILINKSEEIDPTEILIWSGKKFGRSLIDIRHVRRMCLIGLGTFVIIALSFGLGFGLNLGQSYGPSYVLNYGAIYALSFGVCLGLGFMASYWLLASLFQGVKDDASLTNEQRTTPNLGIKRSLSNGLFFGIISGLITALVTVITITLGYGLSFSLSLGLPIGWSNVLSYGLIYGLNLVLETFFAVITVVALYYGMLAWWRHYVVRFLLWRSGTLPWRYIQFLDKATQHILLRKVGGGYRFFHELLRDHLASQNTVPSTTSSSSFFLENISFVLKVIKRDFMKRSSLPLLYLVVTIMVFILPADAANRFQPVHISRDRGHLSSGYIAKLVHADAYLLTLHANKMSPGPSGPNFPSHIDAYMKVDLNNGNWIEVGITNGYYNWQDNKQGPSPRVDYGFYWADSAQQDDLNPDNNIYWVHPIASGIPDGSRHDLAITSQGRGIWYIYLDGQVVGISQYTNSNTARGQIIGIKLAGGDHDGCGNNASADTFRMEPQTWNGKRYVDWSGDPSAQKRNASFEVTWAKNKAVMLKKLC